MPQAAFALGAAFSVLKQQHSKRAPTGSLALDLEWRAQRARVSRAKPKINLVGVWRGSSVSSPSEKF